MKFRSMNLWLAAFATMTIGSWATAANAADEPSTEQHSNDLNSVPATPVAPTAPQTPGVPGPPLQRYQQMQQMQQLRGQADIVAKSLLGARPRTNPAGSIRTAAEAVRDAKGDEAKDDAKKALSNLLGKYFDEDTKRRQEELTQIEERLAKLRELLERRRAKKQDILELQMKVALNEAEGLGFYDSENPGGSKVSNSFFRTTIDGISVDPFGGGSTSAPMTYEPNNRKPEPKKNKSESKSSSQPK
jgi:hypothetical protein